MKQMHWVLTLDMPGTGRITRYGVITPGAKDTRATVFVAAREALIRDAPGMSNANTVFWSLEPNQL